jgi:hypothetical protein
MRRRQSGLRCPRRGRVALQKQIDAHFDFVVAPRRGGQQQIGTAIAVQVGELHLERGIEQRETIRGQRQGHRRRRCRDLGAGSDCPAPQTVVAKRDRVAGAVADEVA